MAEDDARAYVLAFPNDRSEATRIAVQAAQRLQNGEVKLVEVIKATGEYLQNTDENVRERATHYLSEIICSLPTKFLPRQDIGILNTFLSSRIRDGGAVEGLARLASLDRYTQDNAKELAQAIFDSFTDMADKKQAERYQVYLLLNDLLSKQRKAMLDMGEASLLGYIKVVSGEKDPRNLMLIFSMIRVFMIEWDISAHIELVFDSVYAYFPITFRPPPNDPYGITAQDLKDRLRDCLSSNGELAPAAFPRLLEKLDSTSEAVKKDVLQALAACALNYDPVTIANYSITLWDAVKYEVLQAQEPFLADEALNVITNIAACLSRRTSPHATEWKADSLIQYLKPINKESLDHLKEPAARQAGASGDILKAAASATTRSFEIVTKAIGPGLLQIQQTSEGINNQRAILMTVNKLFEASMDVYGTWNTPSEKNLGGEQTLLAEYKDKLLAIYSRALMGTVKEEVSYRLAAAYGLLLLSEMKSMLDDNEIGLIVQHFNEIVLDEESYSRDELKQRAMQALAEISKFKSRLITDITFPKFIARLPDSEKEAAANGGYQPVLEGLSEISVGQDLLETLTRRLFNKLDILFQAGYQAEYPYICAILSTIYFVLERSVRGATADLGSYFERVVIGITEKAAAGTSPPLCNEAVLTVLGRTVNLIARHSSAERKDSVAQNIYRLFRHTNPTVLDPTNVDRYYPQSGLILSTWMLASVPKSSKSGILFTSLVDLVQILAYKASQTSTEDPAPAIEQACLGQITLLVNKHINDQEGLTRINDFFTHTAEGLLQTNAAETDLSDPLFQSQVRYVFTLAKALVLRLAPSTNSILTTLTDLLEQLPSQHARYFAQGFSTILAPDEILSKTNEAQIRLLAPQRVFQTLIPMFNTKFRSQSAGREQKEVYLVALSGILATVSSDIVTPQLQTLLPLLLQSLEISDANQNVKSATLDTMVVVITKNPDALVESGHIAALARRLISVATLPKKNKVKLTKDVSGSIKGSQDVAMSESTIQKTSAVAAPKTRQLALQCLGLIPQHIKDQKTPNPLLVLKKEVLQGLANCLDDPRRDVRKEAVDARARWLRGVDDADDSDEE